MAERVYLEEGAKRVFACAVDWPGWCRSGRDVATALETLAAYAPRYAVVADETGASFNAEPGDPTVGFQVVERVAGSGATDFGVPDRVPAVDAEPLDDTGAARLADLVAASWRVFDRLVAGAPATLRKGPRGGGRDRDPIVEHVVESERSYARQLGVRYTPTQFAQPGALDAMRADLLDALRAARSGEPATGWPPRYAARRIAWHVLDHAWEIEDKSG